MSLVVTVCASEDQEQKVWVLTGDKVDTAISIAMSCFSAWPYS